MTSKCHPPRPRRAWFTNIIGVLTILVGALGSLFSLFALLLAIGKPYANTFDPVGIFLIFIVPPVTFLSGFGLLFRQRWARWWMILVMAGVVALGVKGLFAPAHKNPAYAPVPGPAADALNRAVTVQSFACITLGGLMLLGMLSTPVRREFSYGKSHATPPSVTEKSWRVGHCGRDLMFYEERDNSTWRRLEIDGEMLVGPAHHVIYFASPETWQGYPVWARHRRDEIIARIKSRLCEPDYEYQETGTIPRPAHPSGIPPGSTSTNKPAGTNGTMLPALLFLICVAVAGLWLAVQGVATGETRLPARISGNHLVNRVEKPALYWTSIGLIGTIGITSASAATWLALHRIRSTRH